MDANNRLSCDAELSSCRPFSTRLLPVRNPREWRFSIRQLAEDVIQFIDKLGAAKAVIIGHDWGALAAYAAAAIAPDKVGAIVAVAILPFMVRKDSDEERKARPHNAYLGQGEESALMLQRDDFAEIDRLYTLWSPNWRGARKHANGVKDAFNPQGRSRAAVDYYRFSMSEEDAKAFSVKLPTPALVVYGSDEPEVRKMIFRKTASAFSGPVICKEYAAVGHWPHQEAPESFEGDVIGFPRENGICLDPLLESVVSISVLSGLAHAGF